MTLPNDIDTGVASIPAARPSVFSPAALVAAGGILLRPTDTVDFATNSNAAAVVDTFDPYAVVSVLASPGY